MKFMVEMVSSAQVHNTVRYVTVFGIASTIKHQSICNGYKENYLMEVRSPSAKC